MRLVIIGAGGHSKVVAESARSMGVEEIDVIDPRAGQSIDEDALNATHFIVAIGDNDIRSMLFSQARDGVLSATGKKLKPFSVIDKTAIVSPTAAIGAGTYVGKGAVINVDARIGENAVINTSAVVEHDCVVGDGAFIAPLASMCGETRLGARSMLGVNSALTPGQSVGDDTIIGAGSTVLRSIEDSVVAVGSPAKVIKKR